jgi:hypothetical protein
MRLIALILAYATCVCAQDAVNVEEFYLIRANETV